MTFEEEATLFYKLVFGSGDGLVWTTIPGYPDPESRVKVQVERVADLKIMSGNIIICDPTYAKFPQDCPPLLEQFPQGAWPIYLCLDPPATYLGALVRFGAEEPIRWEMALRPGQDPAKLRPGRFYGFGVDAGVACLMDVAALPAWSQHIVFDPSNSNWMDYDYVVEMGKWKDIAVESPDGSPLNVVIFSAGYGDGSYPCFIGYSERDTICTLLVFFDVFDAEASKNEFLRD